MIVPLSFIGELNIRVYIIDLICQQAFPGRLPTNDLRSLLEICVKNVQFSFDNNLYRQIDGVSMGSPLGPLFAEVFMSSIENNQLKSTIERLPFYCRYVDDVLIFADSDRDIDNLPMELSGTIKSLS